MSKEIQYTDGPIGKIKIIKDFLPPPHELKFRTENKKVTIALSTRSIEYFKSEAKAHHTQYQKMIRQLLDEYVDMQKARGKKYAINEPDDS